MRRRVHELQGALRSSELHLSFCQFDQGGFFTAILPVPHAFDKPSVAQKQPKHHLPVLARTEKKTVRTDRRLRSTSKRVQQVASESPPADQGSYLKYADCLVVAAVIDRAGQGSRRGKSVESPSVSEGGERQRQREE